MTCHAGPVPGEGGGRKLSCWSAARELQLAVPTMQQPRALGSALHCGAANPALREWGVHVHVSFASRCMAHCTCEGDHDEVRFCAYGVGD